MIKELTLIAAIQIALKHHKDNSNKMDEVPEKLDEFLGVLTRWKSGDLVKASNNNILLQLSNELSFIVSYWKIGITIA